MAAKHVHSMPFYVGNILPKKKKKKEETHNLPKQPFAISGMGQPLLTDQKFLFIRAAVQRNISIVSITFCQSFCS